MKLDELLRERLTTLTDRIREEAARQIAETTEALVISVEAEHAAAVANAAAAGRASAEQAAAEMLATAEQRAREEGRRQGIAEGRQSGRDEGFEEGLARGREEGRAEAEDQLRLARDQGRVAGLDEGRKAGHATGLAEGLEQGRMTGFQQGREDGLRAGRLEGHAGGLAEGRVEGTELALARARQEASAQRQADSLAAAALMPGGDTGERLVEGLRLIDGAGSLSMILDALTTSASRQSARVGVLLVRGERLRSWRFVGFGPALDETSGVELPVAQAGIIEEAVRTRGVVLGRSGPDGVAPSFAALPPGRQMLTVPVVLGGQVMAVLYADQGSDEDGDDGVVWAYALEALARHAARSLELVTAVRTVQLATIGTAHGASVESSRVGVVDEPEAARRCARLLVSEIQLHHHSAVAAGRRERDLGSRLGGEIARARAQYEQRVPEHLRRGHDYFQDELVSTLAGGDATLLVDG